MKIVTEFSSTFYPTHYIRKECLTPNTYVSDFCKETYNQFLTGQTYLITCPTGKGKSYMISKEIIPKAYNSKKKVLLLVNRKKLSDQYLKEIQEAFIDGLTYYNPLSHSMSFDFSSCITISTYQQLEYSLSNNLEKTLQDINKYDIVVADEVHYWLSDASFSPTTHLSAEAVLMFLCHKTRYLLSATMEDIKPIILEPGKYINPVFTPKNKFYNPISQYDVSPIQYNQYAVRYNEYIMKADYSHIHVNYFNDIDILIDYIVASDTKSKWLLFVYSITEGKEITNKILNQYKIKYPNRSHDNIVEFISSEYRNPENQEMQETMSAITQFEDIKSKVLVTTSVLYNGINLKSKDLLHIAILTDDKVSFIQMLGRKRILSSTDKIQLYIPSFNINFFKNNSEQIKKKFETISSINSKNVDQKATNILCSKLDNRINSLRELVFAYTETSNNKVNSHISFSDLSLYQSRLLYKRNLNMIKRFEDEGTNAYINEQLSWLGLSYCDNSWLPDTSNERLRRTMETILQPYLSIEFDETIYNKILSKLIKIVVNLVDKARTNRTNLKHLNTALETVESKYRIIILENNRYTVTEIINSLS